MSRRADSCRVCGCVQHRACASRCYRVETDLCSVCAMVQDTIATLCATRPRRWGELLKFVVTNCVRVIAAQELDERRIRKAVGDLRTQGTLRRLPTRHYETIATPVKRARRATSPATVKVRPARAAAAAGGAG